MREIKFRAWDKENKNMLYPKPLSPIKFMLSFSGEFGWFDLDKQMWSGIIPKRYYELMQYTGLKDKNGTEIYEGDLLTDYGEAPPVYVEYSEEHGAYCFVDKFDPSGTVYYTPLMISYEQMEVIGNIYENPELLEGEE
jgi:uncharacterized phage protein (TIGR01671 family)